MASATIGALRVELGINSAQFNKGLNDAQGKLGSFSAGASKALLAFGAAATAAAAAVAVGMKRAIDAADDMSKAAQKIGLTTEELSKLKHAADLSGVSFEGLQTSLARLSRSMADVAAGKSSDAVKAFEALGVSVKNADGSMRSSGDVMTEIAEKFSGMADGANKTALSMAIFGRAGTELIPMLNSGSAGLDAMKREAEDLGLVIDTRAAKAAEAFNDNLTRLARVVDGIWNQLAMQFAPALEQVSNALVLAAKEGSGFASVGQDIASVMKWLVELGASFSRTFRELGTAVSGLGSVAAHAAKLQFAEAGAAMSAMETKLTAIKDSHKAFVAELNKPLSPFGGLATAMGAFGEEKKPDAPGFAPSSSGGGGGGGSGAADRMREQMDARLQVFREALRTTEESEIASHEQRLAEAVTFHERGMLTDAEYADARERLETNHMDRLGKIRSQGLSDLEKFSAMSWDSQLKHVSGTLSRMTASVANENKAMFEAHKIASIADAVISGLQGVAKTMGAYPFPLNVGMAAAHAAVAAMQVQKIASTTFNSRSASMGPSGGSASSAAASAPTPGASGSGGEGRAVHMTINGSSFSRDQVREMLESVGEYLQDGGKLVLA